MDETYIKIKGKWHYLYRAIDSEGMTLDIWLRRKRNTQSAYAFFKRLYKQFKGIEALRGIYKKNRRNGTLFGFSASTEIKVLMGIPA